MSTRHQSFLCTFAAALTLVGLVGCSSPDSSSPDEGKPGTSASEEAAAPTEETGREVPAACAALDLTLGAQLEGTALGECVATAVSSYGSGKIKIAGDSAGDFEFTYDPEFNVQGETETPEGPMKISYLDDVIWMDLGNGPVKGDPDSENQEAIMVAFVGSMTRYYADLTQTAQLIEAQPVWHIDESMDSVTLVSGEQAEAYRIVSAAPFDWNGAPIEEFELWFGEGWVPLSTAAHMNMMGTTATNSQQFYDLGEPVTITHLGENTAP